ncbi:MAG: Gfo/Idh/MocA family oxidoreductase, partial [Chitinophagaceae bacterium]|nr:Gfo/Idh/MocA family oxidoreductase [Chitinophagaceae bacterium]
MKQVKIALLGIGRIGKIHFRNISQHFSNASVVAVSDPQYDQLTFKKEYGDVFFTHKPEEAISHPEVNAVLVCTPTSSHAALVEA